MSRSIHAYFKSEDDAETARAKLQTLRTSGIFVDEMPDADHMLKFYPIPFVNQSSGMGGIADVAGFTQTKTDENESVYSETLTHRLEAEVEDVDYEAAMDALREAGGYREQQDDQKD